MITDFYFDENLFLDESMSHQITNDTLIDTWISYGSLVIADSHSPIKLIENVDPKFRLKWVAYLSKRLYRTLPQLSKVDISNTSNFADLERLMSGACVQSHFFPEGFDDNLLPDGENRVTKNQFELLSPNALNDSTFFTKSKKYSNLYISEGEALSDIWTTRFSSLVRDAKVITIIDRYLIENLIKAYEKNSVTALERFIEKISSSSSGCVAINIYSASDEPSGGTQHELCSNYINNALPNKPYYNSSKLSVEVNVTKSKFFSKESHDRLVRIDDRVVEIGIGFEIFEDRPVRRTNCTIKDASFTLFDDALGNMNRNREWRCHQG